MQTPSSFILWSILGAACCTAAVSEATCDESTFGPAQVIEEFLDEVEIKIMVTTEDAERGSGFCESFRMPSITWTIEPNPDEAANTTSVFISPSDAGKVIYDNIYTSTISGVEINPDAVANAAGVGILVQLPKDDLRFVDLERGSPFNVNIAKGFTKLTTIRIEGGDTCDYGFDCPQCNTLYTSEEVSDIGPSIVVDLSDVNVTDLVNGNIGNTKSIWVASIGGLDRTFYDLTLTLPAFENGGAPVDFHFEAGNGKIEIIGDMNCDAGCVFHSGSVRGCKDCKNELIIDGSIDGYFNVSKLESTEFSVKVTEDGGCDHFARSRFNSNMSKIECEEGSVDIDATPFPCVGDAGFMKCGPKVSQHDGCLCLGPLPEGSCLAYTASGLVVSTNWAIRWISMFAILVGMHL